MGHARRRYGTAASRWAGVGPYYAMFPVSFADRVVAKYTSDGDVVLDPFAGRGTAIFSAATQSRCGIGIEINPVGWLYARTKLRPAKRELVEKRLRRIDTRARYYGSEAGHLPKFFRHCFSQGVRQYLIAARKELDWRRCSVDRTAMALLLIYLHGKAGQALSNQMRQTKSMSPAYAIQWWKDHGLRPPDIDPLEFLIRRLNWRYAKGIPEPQTQSRAYLGNSLDYVRRLRDHLPRQAALLFTSPPYYDLTNYHYDQWLRLWLLGEGPDASRKPGPHRGKFENRHRYEGLLRTVFSRAAMLCTPDATVYVRTGRQQITLQATRLALGEAFPHHRVIRRMQPFRGPTQTHLFGDRAVKAGEVDLILVRK
jgi:DNA modification methylase